VFWWDGGCLFGLVFCLFNDGYTSDVLCEVKGGGTYIHEEYKRIGFRARAASLLQSQVQQDWPELLLVDAK
jgi:hypothetical protein